MCADFDHRLALDFGVGVRMSRIEIDQVLCTCLISILSEDVTVVERKLERAIQFLWCRRTSGDLYVNRS